MTCFALQKNVSCASKMLWSIYFDLTSSHCLFVLACGRDLNLRSKSVGLETSLMIGSAKIKAVQWSYSLNLMSLSDLVVDVITSIGFEQFFSTWSISNFYAVREGLREEGGNRQLVPLLCICLWWINNRQATLLMQTKLCSIHEKTCDMTTDWSSFESYCSALLKSYPSGHDLVIVKAILTATHKKFWKSLSPFENPNPAHESPWLRRQRWQYSKHYYGYNSVLS